MKIPILILTKERPLMLRDMIREIEYSTDQDCYEIIICDNDSRQGEMINYLRSIDGRHTVIRNGVNLLFEGLNPGLELVKKKGCKYFIISDPDILVSRRMPRNWPHILVEIAEKTRYPKIGMALNIDFPIKTPYTTKLKESQAPHWLNKAVLDFTDIPAYEAMIDTTIALYRRDTYNFWDENTLLFDRNHGITKWGWINSDSPIYNSNYTPLCLRLAGDYTAEHIGWFTDSRYKEDFVYYRKFSQAQDVGSTFFQPMLDLLLKDIGENIMLPKDPSKVTPQLLVKYKLPPDFGPSHQLFKVPSYKYKYELMLVEEKI